MGLCFWARLQPQEEKGRCRLRANPDGVLIIAPDRGSDGYAVRQFLKYHYKLMMADSEDPSHGVHDEKLGVQCCPEVMIGRFLRGRLFGDAVMLLIIICP